MTKPSMKKVLKFLKKFWIHISVALVIISLFLMTPHQRGRSIIHFFCAGGVLTASQVGFWFLERKVKVVGKILRGWFFFIIPGVSVIGMIFLREPFDAVSSGDVIKSYLDPMSWLLGVVVFAWAQWRLHERMAICWKEIKKR